MKKAPAIPLAWAAVTLILLLLSTSVLLYFTGNYLERQILLLGQDSVPGQILANRIRSALTENYIVSIRALGLENAGTRQRHLQKVLELDEATRQDIQDYTATILINPKVDNANFNALLAARDRFLQKRAHAFELLEGGSREAAVRYVESDLDPEFKLLSQASDRVVGYNNQTGIAIAERLQSDVGMLKVFAAAAVVLAVVAGFSIGSSLSKRQQSAQAQAESEEKFSKAFYQSPYAMVISQRGNGVIIDANEAFKKFYGLEERDVRGMTVNEVGVWTTHKERVDFIEELTRKGRVRHYLKQRTTAAGRRLHNLISAEPIEIGGKACLLSVAEDITDRVEAEKALAENAEELRMIFDHSAIGIGLVDTSGKLARSNNALQRILGYTHEELKAKTLGDITHPDDVAVDLERLARLFAGELNHYQIEKRYIKSDGSTVWAHVTVTVIRKAGGAMAYALGMVEDITEAKRAALALRESENARESLQGQLIVAQKLEALGQLAGGVAHDFNNILAAIMLHLDLIRTTPGIAPEQQESLGEVIQAARRAAALTRQLLLFGRRELVQRQVVDLQRIVDELLKMLDRLVGEQFTLVQTGDTGPLWLHADAGMVEQIIMNLVVNARDAMDKGGRIVIRTELVTVDIARAGKHPAGRPGKFVRLAVIDSGCGMSEATRARIFEPFFTTKEAGKGTGLGLSTVFGIVQQHGGWVEVESEIGKGSTFAVFLPSHSGQPAAPTFEVATPQHPKGRETILLAEDNETVRDVTARLLRQNGYHVLEAQDGPTAIDIYVEEKGPVHLLLTDIQMPGGLLGLEWVEKLPVRAHTPKVIFMSGHTGLAPKSLLESRSHAFLAKPFASERLLTTVRAVLDGTRTKS